MAKIEWIASGKTANNSLHMQEICNQLDENTLSPEHITSVIKGSDTVVVDVAEDKKTVEVHLDNDITTEIHNSLQKPVGAPTATQLVGIGTNKAQTMISIGDGLEITNGELSVIENQLFMHSITIDIYESDTSVKRGSVTFHLLTNSTAKYDNIQSIISVLDTYGETNCGGSFSYASNSFGIPYVVYKHNNSLAVRLQEYSFDFANSTINILNHIGEDYVLTGNFSVYDTVHQLS